MNILKYLFFALTIIFVASSCDTNTPIEYNKKSFKKADAPGKSDPPKVPEGPKDSNEKPSVEIDNQFLKVEKLPDGSLNFTLKQEVTTPVLVQKDQITIKANFEDISGPELVGSLYLLLPSNHSFITHFLENPFLAENDEWSLLLCRPSLWGPSSFR